MSDIEKRARELLVASMSRTDNRRPALVHTDDALHAIIAALSAAPQVHTAKNPDLRKALIKCDCGCGRDVCADCGADLGFLPQAVPEGWVLVPVEPTEAMIDASMIRVPLAKRVPAGATLNVLGARAWEAMLSVAPELPK